MTSTQRIFGLSYFFNYKGLVSSIFSSMLLSFHIARPAHLSLSNLIWVTVSMPLTIIWYIAYNSWIYLRLHIPFSHDAPKIFLRIQVSKVCSLKFDSTRENGRSIRPGQAWRDYKPKLAVTRDKGSDENCRES